MGLELSPGQTSCQTEGRGEYLPGSKLIVVSVIVRTVINILSVSESELYPGQISGQTGQAGRGRFTWQ